MQFEALVEVGAGGSGGFEAESIDVSPDGIRLRTAYLPELGERLVCRFDGFGGEVVAEGEVIWCREEGRGGEFGVRFVGLDERGAKLLEAMCQPQRDGEAAAESDAQAPIGSRVKLHIQGLGSPMRARVRDTARGEVLVGSSLEFLRVGRDVELEDVEQGGRRVVLIEHVGVEIDAGTNVPQLVVSLRYDGHERVSEAVEEHSTSPYRQPMKQPLAPAKANGKETTPEPTVIDNDDASAGREALPPAEAADAGETDEEVASRAPETRASADEASADRDANDAGDGGIGAASRKLGAIARGLAPKIASAGSSAKSKLGTVLAAVRKKREQRKLEKASVKAPKRTTAPPPSGALRSDGKRLFRQQNEETMDDDNLETEAPKRDYKRKAVAASVIGAIAVVAIYAGATQLNKSRRAPEPAAAAVVAASTAATDSPAPGGPVATANVPLFGATPLSTTEPVPVPPNPEALADEGGSEAEKDGKGADKDGDKDAKASGRLTKSWGVGQVAEPVKLKLTMDGDIAGFTGAEGPNGFTVVVPGRKSVSSASGLARKDKRLEPINPVNYPDRVEVTVRFKGDVPPYSVKASGKHLLIDIDGKKAKKGADDDDAAPKKKKGKGAAKSDGHDKSKAKKGDKGHGSADANAKKADVKSSDAKKSDAKAAGAKKVDGNKAKKSDKKD
jgi:hypothetical protein